jgi:uroporphyrinogen-III synthase
VSRLLILRPQPGADESAARAEALGLQSVVTPLFTITRCDWNPPDPSAFDALMLTSANAPRLAGPALDQYVSLPCYAVGSSTEVQARRAGFSDVRTGPSDGAALLAQAADDGMRRVLHLCGREHVALGHPSIMITPVVVYSADACNALPSTAEAALAAGALVLVHSPRAGRLLARLVDRSSLERRSIGLAAISSAAADAAGSGWKQCAVAAVPRDEALLELAAKLCKTEG